MNKKIKKLYWRLHKSVFGRNFSRASYRQANPDVAAAGVDPWEHYVKYGRKEGRKLTVETTHVDNRERLKLNMSEKDVRKIILASPYFDKKWYVKKYHVWGCPAKHYIKHCFECDPSPRFGTAAYIAEYPNVKKYSVPPLLHYEQYGKHEGCYTFPAGYVEANVSRGKIVTSKQEVKNCRILYISYTHAKNGISVGSARYRCYHPADVLGRSGAQVDVETAPVFLNKHISYEYDIYVFQRPNREFEESIKKLKRAGKILIADYDDLLVGDEKNVQNFSLFVNKIYTYEQAVSFFEEHTQILKLFDFVSASTDFLANEIKKVHSCATVFVLHNFIPQSIIKECATLHLCDRDVNQIIYCSGTGTHNRDFEQVADVLADLLRKDENLKLLLVGPLEVPDKMKELSNVSFHKIVQYKDLFTIMCGSAFSMAPLEMTTFTQCKSNVKFLESCLAGCCMLATPIPDMQRVKDSEIRLFSTPEEFFSLIKNRQKMSLASMARHNYQYLIENCSDSTFLNEFKFFLHLIHKTIS